MTKTISMLFCAALCALLATPIATAQSDSSREYGCYEEEACTDAELLPDGDSQYVCDVLTIEEEEACGAEFEEISEETQYCSDPVTSPSDEEIEECETFFVGINKRRKDGSGTFRGRRLRTTRGVTGLHPNGSGLALLSGPAVNDTQVQSVITDFQDPNKNPGAHIDLPRGDMLDDRIENPRDNVDEAIKKNEAFMEAIDDYGHALEAELRRQFPDEDLRLFEMRIIVGTNTTDTLIHEDGGSITAIATLHGPGTQYYDPKQFAGLALDPDAMAQENANGNSRPNAQASQQGQVLVFNGSNRPGHAATSHATPLAKPDWGGRLAVLWRFAPDPTKAK